MGFLDEVKRRHVVRVGLVYAATAFAVVQAAELAFPRLGLPDWAVTLVLMLALLGLPVALVLAWAFEMTPDGVRRAGAVASPGGTRWLSARSASLAALGLAVALGAGWFARTRSEVSDVPSAPAGVPSIAVLPFVNMSSSAEDEHFSDGLAEELLNLLARVDGLRVAARTSSFAFKDRNLDVRTIGDSLGVQTVLEGSIRRDGDRVRITAQLISVADGYHLWSQTYEDRMASVFTLQDRIAGEITRALRLELVTSALPAGAVPPPPAAHEAFLRGMERFHVRDVPRAIAHFEAALRADSSYAQAWAYLAAAYAILPAFELSVQPAWASERARAAAVRAQALDDRLAESYAAICQAAAYLEWKWQEAERACDAAIARNANSALAHQWRAEIDLVRGDFVAAAAGLERARALDPFSTVIAWLIPSVTWAAGNALAAREQIRENLAADLQGNGRWLEFMISLQRGEEAAVDSAWQRMAPGAPPAGAVMLAARRDPAQRALALRMLEPPPGTAVQLWGMALGHAALGDGEGALDLLERSFSAHEFNLPFALIMPPFDSIRADPRFLAIRRGVGL